MMYVIIFQFLQKREENLVICKEMHMVSYVKVRNKRKKNMKIFCLKLVMES